MIYVYNRAFVFESKRYLEEGLLLIFNHFAKFRLSMHIGRGPKPSRTECILFFQLFSSKPRVIILPKLTSTPPRLTYLQRNKMKNKRYNRRTKYLMNQMRQTESQFQTAFLHSQISSDILEASCHIIFYITTMLIEDSPPPLINGSIE